MDTVIIDGEVFLRQGKFTRINKEDVAKELKNRFSRPLESSVLETKQMVQRLLPYVKRFYQSWQPGDEPPHYRYNSRT